MAKPNSPPTRRRTRRKPENLAQPHRQAQPQGYCPNNFQSRLLYYYLDELFAPMYPRYGRYCGGYRRNYLFDFDTYDWFDYFCLAVIPLLHALGVVDHFFDWIAPDYPDLANTVCFVAFFVLVVGSRLGRGSWFLGRLLTRGRRPRRGWYDSYW